MKKKLSRSSVMTLLISVLCLCLCIFMVTGTTFGWFTDVATSKENKIVAGTLDIDLLMYKTADSKYESIAGETAAIFGGSNSLKAQNDPTDTLWEPGKTQIVYLGVQNLGNLAIKYNIELVIAGDLAPALEYAILPGVTNTTTYTSWSDIKTAASAAGDKNYGTVSAGTLTAAENGVLDEIANGTKDETQYFALAVHMSEDAGKEYMGKDITIDVNVKATQYTAESDSFGDQYDKNATFAAGDDTGDDADDPDALWFDTTVSGATPPDVTSIVFTKTTPEATAYDSTWTAPANSTAYYNSTSKVLTYVPNGDSFKMTDSNLLKISGVVAVKGLVNVTDQDIIDMFNEQNKTEFTTIAEVCAESGLSYEELKAFVEESLSDGCCFENVTSVTGLNLWDVSAVTDFSYMFAKAQMETIDISGWNTESAVSMAYMFSNCENLKGITFGAKWNTANVTDMSYMFNYCKAIEVLPISNWNTSNVTKMDWIFVHCDTLTTLDLSGWNTAKITDMSYMFRYCGQLVTLDLSSFDTSNVTNMRFMFQICSALTNIYVGSGWNTDAVTTQYSYGMFSNCTQLPNFDGSAVDKTHAHTGDGGYLKTKPAA